LGINRIAAARERKKAYIQNEIVSSDCSLRFNLKCTSGSFETEKMSLSFKCICLMNVSVIVVVNVEKENICIFLFEAIKDS
jgi:hypothetical protein